VFGVILEEITGVVDSTVNEDDVEAGSEGGGNSVAAEDGVATLLSLPDRRLALCCDESGTTTGDDATAITSLLDIPCGLATSADNIFASD
jgi:hypothetical protein